MTAEIAIVHTAIDQEEGARALAEGAVKERLAACSHLDSPFEATYWWQGKLEKAREWRISYKTTVDRVPELQAWVHENHPYDVPEFIVLSVVGGSDAYLKWVADETRPQ
ncbi:MULTISPECIES: divalent-cation tolerance protein CutA [unclassified Streptomyces]|uniref:divalent-cation tolerance protein CutA n=1 Tax=unclassified Streptomyces TaxID=2593676 RepID=UPI0034376E31